MEIEGMLKEYETDYSTGMNLEEIADLLYKYTSGYPFLVSRICQLIDEDVCEKKEYGSKAAGWTKKALRKLFACFCQKKIRCSNFCSIS